MTDGRITIEDYNNKFGLVTDAPVAAPPAPATSGGYDGPFIREWREHRGMSQSQIAYATGFDRSVISKVEQRLMTLTVERLALIASALGVDVAKLMSAPPFSAAE